MDYQAEYAKLRIEHAELERALTDIGDIAHAASTGPAVPDILWEIRRIAYDAIGTYRVT